jgi:hypothetical protein
MISTRNRNHPHTATAPRDEITKQGGRGPDTQQAVAAGRELCNQAPSHTVPTASGGTHSKQTKRRAGGAGRPPPDEHTGKPPPNQEPHETRHPAVVPAGRRRTKGKPARTHNNRRPDYSVTRAHDQHKETQPPTHSHSTKRRDHKAKRQGTRGRIHNRRWRQAASCATKHPATQSPRPAGAHTASKPRGERVGRAARHLMNTPANPHQTGSPMKPDTRQWCQQGGDAPRANQHARTIQRQGAQTSPGAAPHTRSPGPKARLWAAPNTAKASCRSTVSGPCPKANTGQRPTTDKQQHDRDRQPAVDNMRIPQTRQPSRALHLRPRLTAVWHQLNSRLPSVLKLRRAMPPASRPSKLALSHERPPRPSTTCTRVQNEGSNKEEPARPATEAAGRHPWNFEAEVLAQAPV